MSYPKTKLEEAQICEGFHRTIGKRRASHQSTEHELEVIFLNNIFIDNINFILLAKYFIINVRVVKKIYV